MSSNLKLSDNKWVLTHVEEKQPYPDHQDRYELPQVLCKHALTGQSCYFEVEWTGRVAIALTYKRPKSDLDDSKFGKNGHSWSLSGYYCDSRDQDVYCAWHKYCGNYFYPEPCFSRRVAVSLDYLAGTLSFHLVSSNRQHHLHTFNATFTEPLYVGFALKPGSSVFLCSLNV